MNQEQLLKVNKYINELIAFRYAPLPIKAIAVPTFEHVSTLYRRMSSSETSRSIEKKCGMKKEAYHIKTKEKDWGEYSLVMELTDKELKSVSQKRVSIMPLDGQDGPMFCENLVYVAERVTTNFYTSHHVSDIRHLMYLEEHPDEVPEVMKNGKGNIFAGTVIMICSIPHVAVAIWQGDGFKVELYPLSVGLEDVAQFVMIQKV